MSPHIILADSDMEFGLTIATFALAAFTGWLAVKTAGVADETKKVAEYTLELAQDAKESSYRQIGVQTWLEMIKQWDSSNMIRARRKLANSFSANALKNSENADNQNRMPIPYSEVTETIPNFFESIGTLYENNFIDKNLTESSFSYHCCRWHESLKDFIAEDRKIHNDQTIFEDFEKLAKALRLKDEAISYEDLERFWNDETRTD